MFWSATNDYDEHDPEIRVKEFYSFWDDDAAAWGKRWFVPAAAAAAHRQQQPEYDRSLKDKQGATIEPTSISPTTIAPTTGDIDDKETHANNKNTSKTSEPSTAGFFILWWILLVVAILVIGRICYQRFRRRQERLLSDYRSAQADRVLGDMQMVPNADLDDADDHDIL
jgi:hypothetical protein